MREIQISEIPKYVETFLTVRDTIQQRVAEQIKNETEKNIEPMDKKKGSEVSTVGAYDSRTNTWIT